ncbi:MAG: hypothetical protein GTN69_06695 [Armatimonadetes bacterium]|nr:hypothetical protein [Armatimonadota bacterium]
MTGKERKPRRSSDDRSTGKSTKTPAGKFGRALLPPEKFHSTKKGSRGYHRANEKEEARRAEEELEDNTSSSP